MIKKIRVWPTIGCYGEAPQTLYTVDQLNEIKMKNLKILLSIIIVAIGITAYSPDCPAQSAKPEDVVKSLYRDFGWEIKNSNYSKKLLVDQPVTELQHYFTARLAGLIAKDRKYVKKTRDVGHLDFVLLCGSQDPDGITNIRIAGNPGKDAVAVTYDQNGEKDVMKIEFNIQQTKSGWRISDVHYRARKSNAFPEPGLDVRLLELLSQPY